MPFLIKSIQGNVSANIKGDLSYIKNIVGEIQREDYIYLNSFNAYLQNLSKTEQTFGLKNPLIYGLKNKKNLVINNINISF